MSITLVSLAKEARGHFTQKLRDNSGTFWTHDVDSADEKNAWIYDMTRDAHSGMLPDDYTYAFIVDALNLIVDNEPEDVYNARDIEIEPDMYTSDLLKWLSSRNARLGYCDDYVQEFGVQEIDTEKLIAGGQYMERREVFDSVLDSLSAELEAREEEEDGTSGQDRDNYTDEQDRENYTIEED